MADRCVKLYYFPPSYYSQKVLIAAQEKELKYEPVIVNIHGPNGGEQVTAPYMRLSANKGQVPVLQDGEKIITESEDIVDYIDREFPADIKLVPDLSTEIGREVAKWRKELHAVPIELITFGIMVHPELSASGPKFPPFIKKKSGTEVLANLQINAARLEKLADEHPDLREAYLAKSAALQKRRQGIAEKEKVVKILDELETTLDQVEAQLKKVDADPSKELWFCGQQFTAADITLCIMLGRLRLLGLSERYHSAEKRPRVHAYWQAAQKRPTVNRVVLKAMRELIKMKVKEGLLKALPVVGGLVTVGLAAGLAFILAQKR